MSKPGTWTLAAVDHFSSWDEHEAAVQMATRHWMWLIGSIKDTPEQHARRVELARKSLGMNPVTVSTWGNA